MPWFASELAPLLAVVAAALDEDSVLIEANAGFLKLIEVDGRQPIGAHASRFFIQPSFADLARVPAGANGEIHRGLLTMGDHMGQTRTLRGRVWRAGARLHLLAEYDVEELERLNNAILALNNDYAEAQRAIAQVNLELKQREAQIVAISLTDQLTGVGNRHQLERELAREISRATRSGDKLCALMADLDHFKRVNDTHGHEAGDKVLAAFGKLLRQQTRATDIVTRFGGEEFVVLMPKTVLEEAVATAERIRAALAVARVEPLSDPVTGSFGVAELAAGEAGDALLRRIDKALYAAKQAGRDQVITG
ncbi:MAG: GGDEF domain-containing protein [Burkholderiales bacterium]|nr:GGDEF domain-containing protein [Burkholderiales bacterium]